MKNKLISIIPFLISCSANVEEHFILPYGYNGEVTVIFDEPCGIKVEKNANNIREYNIPQSGILITNVPHQCNTNKRIYYYKKANGELVKIKQMTEIEEKRKWDEENPNILDPERQELGVYMLSCGYKGDNGINSQSAFILNYNQLQDSLSDASYSVRRNNTIVSELKDCRSK